MRRGRIVGLVVLVCATLVGAAAIRGWRSDDVPAEGSREISGPRAPDSVRIRVQVLNGTDVRGLGRRAVLHLRDRGFDVVDVGNAPERTDSTLVLDRSGHPEWAALVAQVFGGARVEARPDSSRYLDVTVVIGASWRPPAEPFYP